MTTTEHVATILISLALVVAGCLALNQCAPSNLTPAQQRQVITEEENVLKAAAAAGLGYAAGGTAGAIAGGLGQVVKNHTHTTAAKNPVHVQP